MSVNLEEWWKPVPLWSNEEPIVQLSAKIKDEIDDEI